MSSAIFCLGLIRDNVEKEKEETYEDRGND